MNRLIILGNGFDLAHGLKTSYKSFLADYLISVCKEIEYEDENVIFQAATQWSGVLKMINQILTPLVEGEDIEGIMGVFRGMYVYNFKVKNFLLQRLINDNHEKWVDIEMTYYKYLKELFYNGSPDLDAISRLNNELENIKILLIDYLTRSVKEGVVDGLSNEKTSFLKRALYDFDKIFRLPDKDGEVLFLNFNYTNTIELYLKQFSNESHRYKVTNIHGQLGDLNSVVFGFGDEVDSMYQEMEDFNSNLLFHHIKSFKYFQYSNYSKLHNFMQNRYEVYVIGHSCGLSDRTLLSFIFGSQTCWAIRLFPHNDQDFVNTTFEISRHFQDKVLMRSRVVNRENLKLCPQIDLPSLLP